MKKMFGRYILTKREFEFAKTYSIAFAEIVSSSLKAGVLNKDASAKAEQVVVEATEFLKGCNSLK